MLLPQNTVSHGRQCRQDAELSEIDTVTLLVRLRIEKSMPKNEKLKWAARERGKVAKLLNLEPSEIGTRLSSILMYINARVSDSQVQALLSSMSEDLPPECNSVELQIGNTVYWLNDDGLQSKQCQTKLQVLAAWMEQSITASTASESYSGSRRMASTATGANSDSSTIASTASDANSDSSTNASAVPQADRDIRRLRSSASGANSDSRLMASTASGANRDSAPVPSTASDANSNSRHMASTASAANSDSGSTASAAASANSDSRPTLVLELANVIEGDELRMHITGQKETKTVALVHSPGHDGPATVRLKLPRYAQLDAVEQLRDQFASQRAKVQSTPPR